MKSFRILIMLLMVGVLAAGCSQDTDLTAPANQASQNNDKDGTEMLGVPSISIAAGSGFVEGGTGMSENEVGTLDFTVPAGAIVNQVLLYWAGGTNTGGPGDDSIMVDGESFTGMLIGGPTNFYGAYFFSAYRADITNEVTVTEGYNEFEISDFMFPYIPDTHDENNGVSMVVIYDDGTSSDLTIVDGLDMAFFDFNDPLDRTVPQTFTFAAEPMDRTADLLLCVGSVYLDRPNQIKVTTSAGDEILENVLNSTDGLTWDSMTIPVTVPAGDTSLTVELISPAVNNPLGASMGWVGAGLSVPTSPPPELGCLGDYVWVDANMDGIQDDTELGMEGVTVYLFDCEGNELGMTVTDMDGLYMFCELEAGQYMVQFMLPDGYEFSPQDMGGDDEMDSDADPSTGMTMCIDLGEGENDLTWDAGIFMPVELGCLGDYVWVDANMDGIQDDTELGMEGVTVYLFDCEGNELASTVTDMYGMYMFCELPEGQYMVQFMSPMGYMFSPQDMGGDDELDSDADPTTGMTICIDLGEGEHDYTWDAGLFVPVEEGCTLTIGYWKGRTGLGNGNQDDEVSQHLPITLGDEGGAKSLVVTDNYMALDVLKQRTYGRPNNGITKLYAQLLAAKLNFASGASDNAVADYVSDADAFLADHDHDDWGDLTDEEAEDVMMWHGSFDDYNNGDIGPGHCDKDNDDDEDEGKAVFK